MVKTSITRWLRMSVCLAGASAFAGTSIEPRLSLMAEQRYDDDLRDTTSAFTSNLQSKLSPKAGFELSDPRATGQGWYATDLRTRFSTGSTEVDHRAQLATKWAMTELSTADIDVRFWRVTDPTSLPRMGMPRVLDPIRYGTAQLGGTTHLTRRFTARLQYRFEGAQIEAPGARVGHVHAPSVETWYKLTRTQEAGAEYRFQYFGYGDERSYANGAFLGYRVTLDPSTLFVVRGGPLYFQRVGGGGGWTGRGSVELSRHMDGFELGLSAGHDLVGASGFMPAVWADYATFALATRLSRPLRVFGAVSYFRNGRAPHEDFTIWRGPRNSQGYALGGGLEWIAASAMSFQLSFDRIAQVQMGDVRTGVDLTRNVAAVRMVLTAF